MYNTLNVLNEYCLLFFIYKEMPCWRPDGRLLTQKNLGHLILILVVVDSVYLLCATSLGFCIVGP